MSFFSSTGDQKLFGVNTTEAATHQEEDIDAADEAEMADFGVPGNRAAAEEGAAAQVGYTLSLIHI